MNSGTRGKRPASSSGTVGGGKPADNVPDGSSRKGHRATPATYADEWGVAPRRNLRKRRYYRRGKWLTPSSQKARRLAHWFLSPMSAIPLPARRKAGSYGLLSLLDGKSGNAHIAIARKSRENASGRESGRRRRSNQKLFCNGGDRVKVRQGRLKRTVDQQVNQGMQMTEEVMVPCSPA